MQQNEKSLNAAISFAAAGVNEIIAAPTAGRIVIDHINLLSNGDTTLTLRKGSTDFSGGYLVGTGQGLAFDNTIGDRDGLLDCGLLTAFNINNSNAIQISGFVKYRILDAH